MDRRTFLRTTAMTCAASLGVAPAVSSAAESELGWRSHEITTQIEVLRPSGVTRIWVPVPLSVNTNFQRHAATDFACASGRAQLIRDEDRNMAMVYAEFPAGKRPVLTVVSRVTTRDWAIDFGHLKSRPLLHAEAVAAWLRPTNYVPTDGIVRQRAVEITRGAETDLDKARAIYEWIVVNTYRNPKTRGCGRGDIRFMLETDDLGGKCADLNALFVGLARAAGLAARDAYGIRVAPSAYGYRSLGTSSNDVTKAQHCRAEVYLRDHGWVPVDPADVRKVILEEPPGHLPLTNSKVSAARARLFGSWEMNWVLFNYAHNLQLPGSQQRPVSFFMYPQAETAEGRLDCLDSTNFRYSITARPGGSAAL